MSGATSRGSALTRRRLLASSAATVAGLTGCLQHTRNVLGRNPTEGVSLRILAMPADADPFAMEIARQLSDNLETCGVSARVEPMAPEALYRSILVNHDFDLYVTQLPPLRDPDELFSLLHSVYASEPGWQNPLGFTHLELDELLERQRSTDGETRQAVVTDVQDVLAETQPFTPIAFPDTLGTVRTDRFRGWVHAPTDPRTLLGLECVEGVDAETLRLATHDGRITENRNPLAAEFRYRGTFVDLMYDSLGRRLVTDVGPWLADGWQFDERGDGLLATVSIRDGATWHDGTSLTASDVVFTYRFLRDTSMGNAESEVPASRFRGRVSLVDGVRARDERTVALSMATDSRSVAERAFTVPVLPRHVWSDKTGEATVAGVEPNRDVTQALVWNNPDPVGSGPLQFERATPSESLVLSRFDDHFLFESGERGPLDVPDGLAYDRLHLNRTSSDDSVVELVAAGDADATVAPLGPGVVPRIGRNSDLELRSDRSRSLYHVGYNTRTAPLSNPRFRRIVAHLVDKQHVVENVLDGYARPAASPLAGTRWLPAALEWEGTDPATPFFGSKGELAVSEAKTAFTEAGFRYADGTLVLQ
jgi:peptide/nickel transport system substrate-binding protein